MRSRRPFFLRMNDWSLTLALANPPLDSSQLLGAAEPAIKTIKSIVTGISTKPPSLTNANAGDDEGLRPRHNSLWTTTDLITHKKTARHLGRRLVRRPCQSCILLHVVGLITSWDMG